MRITPTDALRAISSNECARQLGPVVDAAVKAIYVWVYTSALSYIAVVVMT